jgi:hypothetical protein
MFSRSPIQLHWLKGDTIMALKFAIGSRVDEIAHPMVNGEIISVSMNADGEVWFAVRSLDRNGETTESMFNEDNLKAAV